MLNNVGLQISRNVFIMRKENYKYLKSLTNCPICNKTYLKHDPKKCCDLHIGIFDNDEFHIQVGQEPYEAVMFDYDFNELNFYYEGDFVHTEKFNNVQEIIEFIKNTDIKKYIDRLNVFK